MTQQAQQMMCEDVERLIHPYVDGEFSPDDEEHATFERHLAGCKGCRELASYQTMFKSALRQRMPQRQAPAALVERIKLDLARAPLPVPAWRRNAWKVAPVAAAAAMLLLLGVSLHRRGTTSAVVSSSIAKHTSELPVEIASRDADSVRTWFRGKVAFPVRAPHFREVPAVQLVGARLSNLRDRDAAYLVYEVNGAKVSVFVFDPSLVELGTDDGYQMVAGRKVYLDESGPYNVALFSDRGVGYAITGDVDQKTMLRLVSASLAGD